MVVALFTECVTIALLAALVAGPPRMGITGAALASLGARLLQCAACIVIALRDADMRRCWPGCTSEALRGWPGYLVLGIPACFMLLCEARARSAPALRPLCSVPVES